MDTEQIQQRIEQLNQTLIRVANKLVEDSPVAQRIRGQIDALTQVLEEDKVEVNEEVTENP